MIRRICGVRLCDRKRSEELERMIGLQQDIITLVGQSRLRWYGHVMRREKDNGIRRVLDWEVAGTRPKGRSNLTWEAVVRRDMKKNDMEEEMYVDRKRWRRDVAMYDETRLPP